MAKVKDMLVEIICLDCCDGDGGRCQRYPRISRSCSKFPELEKAYRVGIREVVEWVEEHNWKRTTTREEWLAQLKEWGIE